MNKAIATKAMAITKKLAKAYGAEVMLTLNPDPMNEEKMALYLDGDIVDLYWNNNGFGWDFQEKLQDAWDEAGIFVEPYTSTIFSVYKK